jgi:SAM-dependent methyltransferase
MNEETLKAVSGLPTREMAAFEISGEFWATRCEWKSYVNAWYPQFDLNHNVMPELKFDMIIIEQVLEHVKYPWRGISNIHDMLNPGGWLLVTTPFLMQIHSDDDYTRWTAAGLKCLLEECGFPSETIAARQWGNRECAVADFQSCAEGRGWHEYEAGKHSLVDEFCYPVVVWALAQRGEAPARSWQNPEP